MSDPDPPPVAMPHVRGVRAYVLQIALGAVALACFVAAIVTAGMVLLSGLLLLGGFLALLLLAFALIRRVNAWGAIQQARQRRRDRTE